MVMISKPDLHQTFAGECLRTAVCSCGRLGLALWVPAHPHLPPTGAPHLCHPEPLGRTQPSEATSSVLEVPVEMCNHGGLPGRGEGQGAPPPPTPTLCPVFSSTSPPPHSCISSVGVDPGPLPMGWSSRGAGRPRMRGLQSLSLRRRQSSGVRGTKRQTDWHTVLGVLADGCARTEGHPRRRVTVSSPTLRPWLRNSA